MDSSDAPANEAKLLPSTRQGLVAGRIPQRLNLRHRELVRKTKSFVESFTRSKQLRRVRQALPAERHLG